MYIYKIFGLICFIYLFVYSSALTTSKIIERHGYPVESHTVQTVDGYILTMHRIPYSSKTGYTGTKRPVAFLMHGLLCSSADWIVAGPDNGLAFILADAGFDVWMGNARGNTYSKKHVSKSPLFQPFWNFEWHHIGIYDLPAMIDYVLYWTGVENVRYFGHSQGTTAFFVLNSMIPRYKNYIRSAHLLAPVAYMENMESPLAKVGGPLLGQPNGLVEVFGSAEFLPNNYLMSLLGMALCQDNAPTQVVCTNTLFLIGGWDSPHLNTTMLPDILGTTPAGSSINQMEHYLQEYNSGEFRQFDFGKSRNKRTYGSKTPPEYDLDNIDVPVYLYYSDNDYFASLIDVHLLIRLLPERALKRAYRMPYPKWNHLDFMYALDLKAMLHDVILEDIANS